MTGRTRDMNFLVTLVLFVTYSCADELILNVNVKKPIAVTSEKFLSLTVDPIALVHDGDLSTTHFERSAKLAKTLAPAYVRFASPESNSYAFSSTAEDSKTNSADIFTESHWTKLHQWAEKSGLDVISCISPRHVENEQLWNPKLALELISFTDRMNYNTSWQLGYECQIRCDVSGTDLGKYVTHLRNILDAFPRYFDSIITGPDIVTYKTKQQQQYLLDYLYAAGPALSAITWHPDFAGVTSDNDGVTVHQDNLARDKEELYKIIGRSAERKPLWLAESTGEQCKEQFLGALVWTRRLGNAAKLGAQVLMRKPANLSRPTPDYWVSVLHKTLVGREVLDTKIQTANRSHVYFYSHCTKPSSSYEKGSLTIFGVNLTPGNVVAALRGIKVKNLHEYILLPGFDATNRLFSETVLLNNKPLNFTSDVDLSCIKPSVVTNSKGLDITLPSGAIGFWVIPDAKVKSCVEHEEETHERTLSKKAVKRIADGGEGEDFASEEETNERGKAEELAEERRRMRRKWRKYEHEEEQEGKRRNEVRKYLEILEKVLKRKLGAQAETKPLSLKGSSALFVSNDVKQPDVVSEKLEKPETKNPQATEQMKAKLEGYKNRLLEYQNRKDKLDNYPVVEGTKSETDDNKNINAERATEVLKLITKIERAIEFLEQESSDNSLRYSRGRNMASTLTAENPEKQLQMSKKVQRVTAQIEENLATLYRLLSNEENSKRESTDVNNVSSVEEPRRSRRSLEITPEDESLFSKKDNILKRRTKPDESKDRRNDRPARRKESAKKEGLMSLYDHKNADSNENSFFGFAKQEPLKGFPQGDIYLTTGDSEERNDYDYVDDNEENPTDQKSTRLKMIDHAEPDDTWVGDGSDHLGYVPNEFYEITNIPKTYVNEKLKNYGELWEAESFQRTLDHPEFRDDKSPDTQILVERKTDAAKDDQTKEKTLHKLMKYYKETEDSEEEEEQLEDSKMDTHGFYSKVPTFLNKNVGVGPTKDEAEEPRVPSMKNGKGGIEAPRKVKSILGNEDEVLGDFGAMHFPSVIPMESQQSRRPKRKLNDLDDIFKQEMIAQDDTNLKDCQCRVNRGMETGPNDVLKEMKQTFSAKPKQWEMTFFPAQYFRFKRNAKEVEENKKNEENEENEENEGNEEAAGTEGYNETETEISEFTENVESADPAGLSEFEVNNNMRDEILSDEFAADAIVKRDFPAQQESEELREEQNEDFEETEKVLLEETFDSEKSFESSTDTSQVDKVERPSRSATDTISKTGQVPSGVETEHNENITNSEKQFFLANSGRHDENSSVRSVASSPGPSKHPRSSAALLAEESSEGYGEVDSAATENVANGTATIKAEENSVEEATATSVTAEGKKRNAKFTPLTAGDSQLAGEQRETDVVHEETSTSKPNGSTDPDDTITEERSIADEKASEDIQKETDQKHSAETRLSRMHAAQRKTLLPKSPSESSKSRNVCSRNSEDSKGKTRSYQRAEEVAKAIESRLAARAEAVKALQRENELRAQRLNARSAKNSSNENSKYQEYQKRRSEQLEKLKDRLIARREKIMQMYRNELQGVAEKSPDDERRNLKRREVWEKFRGSDDFRKMIDQEKMAYVLTHKPGDYGVINEDESEEDSVTDKRYIPLAELTRPLHQLRERIVNMRNLPRISGNPNVMRYLDKLNPLKLPYPSLEELTRSREEQRNSQRGSGKVYYSIVDNLNEPRIFEYQPKKTNLPASVRQQNSQESSASSQRKIANVNEAVENDCEPAANEQETSKSSPLDALLCRDDQLSRMFPYENVGRYETEEQRADCTEDSEETTVPNDLSGNRIYAIDPSSYRGGDPVLEVIDEITPQDEETLDINYRPLSIDQLAKLARKLPQSLSYADLRNVPILSALTRGQSPFLVENPLKNARLGRLEAPILYVSRDATEIPKRFMSNLPTELLSRLNPQNVKQRVQSLADNASKNLSKLPDLSLRIQANVKPANTTACDVNLNPLTATIRSVLNKSLKKLEKKEVPTDQEYTTNETLSDESSENTSSMITAETAVEENKNFVEVKNVTSAEEDRLMPNGENTDKGIELDQTKEIASRKRRDLRTRDDSLERIRSVFSPRTLNRFDEKPKTGRSRYVYLTDDSTDESIEDQNKLFKLVKENGVYKAIPVEFPEIDDSRIFKAQELSQRWENKYQSPKYMRLLPQDVRNRWQNDRIKPIKENKPSRKTLDVILIPADAENDDPAIGNDQPENDWNSYDEKSASSEALESEENDFDTILEDSVGHRYRGKQLTAEKFPHLYNLLKSTKSGSVLVLPWENEKLDRHRRHVSNEYTDEEPKNEVRPAMHLFVEAETDNSRDEEFKSDVGEHHQGKNIAQGSNVRGINNVWSNIMELRKEERAFRKHAQQNRRLLKELQESRKDMKDNLDRLQDFDNIDNKINSDFYLLDAESPEVEVPVTIVKSSILNRNSIDSNLCDNEKERKHVKRVHEKDEGLTSYVEKGIPKIENAISGGLEKVKNFTESFEQFVENFDDKFNETLTVEDRKKLTDNQSSKTQNTFNNAILCVKKIFGFLYGVTQLLHR